MRSQICLCISSHLQHPLRDDGALEAFHHESPISLHTHTHTETQRHKRTNTHTHSHKHKSNPTIMPGIPGWTGMLKSDGYELCSTMKIWKVPIPLRLLFQSSYGLIFRPFRH